MAQTKEINTTGEHWGNLLNLTLLLDTQRKPHTMTDQEKKQLRMQPLTPESETEWRQTLSRKTDAELSAILDRDLSPWKGEPILKLLTEEASKRNLSLPVAHD